MATNYSKLKKRLEELKYTDPNITVIEDEKGNKVHESIKPNLTTNVSPIKKTNFVPNVGAKKTEDDNTWFKAGAFDDGYQFGDLTKTILGTGTDAVVGVGKGIFNMAEGMVDLSRYGVAGVADLLGADNYAEGVRERAKQNTTNILFNGIENMADENSVLGNKADTITQGVGYVAGLYGTAGLGKLAGLGSKGGRLLTTGATFSSSMGSEMSNAYNQGATDTEALVSGLISGSVEALTENMFGGLGKTIGKGALDDVVAGTLTKKISNQTAKALTQAGIKAGGEGFEEVVSNIGQSIGQYLTYDTANENNLINKEFMSKLKDGYDFGDITHGTIDTIFNEENLDNFITGMVVSSIAQAPSVKTSIDTKRDFITGYTQNEQSIIDKEVENRIKELETDNKKLTNKEKTKIKEQVENDLQKGYISTDTIESTIGGEEYNAYKSALDNKTTIENEIKELENKNFAELKVSEKERLDSLREELKTIDTNTLRSNLEGSMVGKIANDGYLQRSYQEKANKSVKFEADVTKYDAKQQEVIQKAIDSGILNNTNKTHEFVDMVAKISADKGVSFDFANNAKLKESGFAIDGKQVNGLVNENGITVNIDSSNALNKVVGHEITHVLEGTELYTELQQAVKEYATTKGVYDTKLAELTELYKGVDKANIENELTSDLVGEYLFTDVDFVNNLSTTKPNVFKKIYNEIKYLLKVATAGSKEARQLEKVKKTFEEAYRNSATQTDTDTKYSVSDNQGRTLTKEQQEYFKDSKVRDENGNLLTVYHGTGETFTKFEKEMIGSNFYQDSQGFFFTDDIKQAEDYANTTSYGMPRKNPGNVMETYLNITNPLIENIDFDPISHWDENYERLIEKANKNGNDGVIIKAQKYQSMYVAFEPNQIKNVDNANPTTNEDIRYSLGEDTTPKQSNLTYGEDVALQISPLQEEISKVVEEVQQMREQIDKMVAPTPEYRNNTYEDLEALEQQYNENFENMDTENVPEGIDDNSNFFLSEETDMVESEKQVKDVIRNTLGLNVRQTSDVYKSITAIEDFDIDDVKNAIEEYSQFISSDTDTNLQDLKKAIRTTKLDISYLKATDSNFKDQVKNAFGTMRLANSGQSIDSFYNEMSSMYPDLLPSNIDNEADQFQRLLEVSKMDHVTKYTEAIPEEAMNEYANEIYKTIKNYQDNLAIQNSNKDFFNAVRKGEIIAPVENDVDNASNMHETVELAPLSGKQVKVEPKLAPTSMEVIERSQATINNEPSRVEQQTAQILDEKPTKKNNDKRLKTIATVNLIDKGYYISKLARQTNNRQLDALWDNTLLSNAQAQEVIGEGRFKLNEETRTYEKVGDSVYEIFEGLENTNKVKDFNEYMYHKLNIERMSLEDNASAKMKNLKETTLKTYTNEEINKMARMQLREDADQSIKDLVEASKEYRSLSKIKNKPVFGFNVDANASIDVVNRLEQNNPEFSDYAKKVYEYESGTYGDLAVLVESGILSQEDANYYKGKYESYVPIMRDMEATMLEGQMFGKRVSVGNAVKSATGGSQDIIPLKDAMAIKTMLVQRSANMNKLGLELMHVLNPVTETETMSAEKIIDDLTNNKDIVQAGTNGKAPTMTVYEHGVKHTFEIPMEIYEALKTNYDSISKMTIKPLNAYSSFKRGVLTQYNPFFMVTNMIKDAQDILINSQHPATTYASIPEAIAQLTTKGYWYKEMQSQGLFQDTYYDNQQGFDTTKKGLSKITEFYPLRKISEINDFIERVPRMAEYIASRKAGASVEVASLDASRVTTNFKAGGDFTKFLNRNGFTFLNASVQGATQQVRNFQEAHQQGLKGYMKLATKFVVATLPAVLLNNLLWDDDEEYEELSDYIKDNYYIIGKYGDGQFIRIPKGRMTAVIQDGFEQMTNLATGDDEVDLKNFLNLVTTNLAPSNPIENNILSPFLNTKLFSKDDPGKTWYGEDLVPTRLQDKPIAEQYDESTDEFSKWLGAKLNLSPIKINNLIDQNTGVIGDLLLPMMTTEAKTKNSNPIMAGIEDKFTADVVFDNKYSTDFYTVKEELTKASNGYDATDEDILKTKYMNSKQSEMNDIYAEIRDVQNSNMDKEVKYAKVRELRKQLNDIAETSLNSYEDVNIGSNYAKVGEIEFRKNTSGEWEKINAKQLEKQNEVTSTLGVSADDYWNNKEEYDYAYENPSKYATATAIADYKTYKTYVDEINDLSADKDSDGKTISGSRKQKVFDYVNGLDLSFEQKVMLAKLEYPSYDEYNYEIVDYLNNRNDINYDEMVSILTELGFKVDANGVVSWD